VNIHLVRNSLSTTFSQSQKLRYVRTRCTQDTLQGWVEILMITLVSSPKQQLLKHMQHSVPLMQEWIKFGLGENSDELITDCCQEYELHRLAKFQFPMRKSPLPSKSLGLPNDERD
jgi:hypothetical protein